MQKEKYYWLCSYKLEVGSVINPGNWGRIIKMYAPQNNHAQALIATREYIFESIRLKNYPDKPSRLESIFLCKTIEDAQELHQKNRQFDLIYEIELVNDGQIFETDMALVNNDPNDTILAIEGKANLYWNHSQIIKSEILTDSPIKIVGAFEIGIEIKSNQ
jgi:hypothetical protein